jgi:hypothetical protein
MAWTQIELDALRRAYASGTLRVTYDGKTVEYGSVADLLSRIRTVEAGVASDAGKPRPVAGFASFRRN